MANPFGYVPPREVDKVVEIEGKEYIVTFRIYTDGSIGSKVHY